ncbi:hypothetical protein LDG_7502 [Legionella drancourtii LLAP12]|uniref:Uncharacterized protein n=1 Tax=Legionella drancourtii LLAP12 TaxID=658187 RepID=G9EQF5_9GAMM|nr:hypothetical protein LDG_7502 [Legionella drancourtii LLAP12]
MLASSAKPHNTWLIEAAPHYGCSPNQSRMQQLGCFMG